MSAPSRAPPYTLHTLALYLRKAAVVTLCHHLSAAYWLLKINVRKAQVVLPYGEGIIFSLTLNTYEDDRDSSTTAKNVETPPWITATPISDTACETKQRGGEGENKRDVSINHGIYAVEKNSIVEPVGRNACLWCESRNADKLPNPDATYIDRLPQSQTG